jgi:hypothetical protein
MAGKEKDNQGESDEAFKQRMKQLALSDYEALFLEPSETKIPSKNILETVHSRLSEITEKQRWRLGVSIAAIAGITGGILATTYVENSLPAQPKVIESTKEDTAVIASVLRNGNALMFLGQCSALLTTDHDILTARAKVTADPEIRANSTSLAHDYAQAVIIANLLSVPCSNPPGEYPIVIDNQSFNVAADVLIPDSY